MEPEFGFQQPAIFRRARTWVVLCICTPILVAIGALYSFAQTSGLPSSSRPGAPEVISTGNSSTAARLDSPTGQILLDRNAPAPSTNQPSRLELTPAHNIPPIRKIPSNNAETRSISSNMLQEALPRAVEPTVTPDYSTASPYPLRSTSKSSDSDVPYLELPSPLLSKQPVQSRQVSQILESSETDPAIADWKANAPKVSRKQAPASKPADLSNNTATQSTPQSATGPTTKGQVTGQALRSTVTPDASGQFEAPSVLGPVPSLDAPVPLGGTSALPLTGDLPKFETGNSASTESSDSAKPTEPQLPALPSKFLPVPTAETGPLKDRANTQAEPPSQSPAESFVQPPQVTRTVPSSHSPSLSLPSSPSLVTDQQWTASQLKSNSQSPTSSSINNRSSVHDQLRTQAPRVAVSLLGPKQLSIGQSLPYQLVVKNDDKLSLAGVIVRLDVPPGVIVQPQADSTGQSEIERAPDGTTMLTWTVERLESGRESILPLMVQADSPRNFAFSLEWTLLPIAASASIEVLTPQLELALEGPHDVNYGQSNVYRLHIRNRGNAMASDVAVKLTAEHFGSSSTQIGQIAPGGQQTIDVELVFNEPGNIAIAAEATAAGNVTANSQVHVRVQQALLDLSLEAPEIVYHSSPSKYVVRLQNSGDAIAKSAKVLISLPIDSTVSNLPTEATIEQGNIAWTVPTVRPGQMIELPFNLALSREGDNRISVQCSAVAAMPTQCVAVTSVKAVSDLKLFVTDPVAPAPVNGEVTYELTLVNRGSKAAEQVSVAAMFSKDVEPTRTEGHRSQLLPGQVRFLPIARIEPGQSVSLKVFAKANAAGKHRFRAEVRTAETDVRLVQEQSTEYLEAIRRTANSPSNVIR